LDKYLGSLGFSWSPYPEVIRNLYNEMTDWKVYLEYMSADEESYKADARFIKELVTQLLPASSDLEGSLEEQSVYWNDDLPFVTAMIRNTIGKFREGDDGKDTPLSPMFTNSDDERYAKVLLRKVLMNSDSNTALIDKHTTNWEVERIALMDKLVMQLAVTEIVEFPEVPVKVTLNEYIEIAKDYCTDKSSNFVNGILDKLVQEMRANNSFAKSGRGLIGEPTVGEDQGVQSSEHGARGREQRAKRRERSVKIAETVPKPKKKRIGKQN
jgi:N utilization substance protein B